MSFQDVERRKTDNLFLVFQRTQLHLNIDDSTIFKTPRKLIHSLQDSDEVGTGFPEKQITRMRRPTSHEVKWSPKRQINENDVSQYPNHEDERNSLQRQNKVFHESNVADAESEPDGYESVSSTGDGPVVANEEASYEAGDNAKNVMDRAILRRQSFKKVALTLLFGVSLILPVTIFSAMLVDYRDEFFNLVPT